MPIPPHPISGRRGSRPWIPLLILLATAGLVLLVGCEINSPEMPSFNTSVTIPLGVERIEILDALDDKDYLIQEENGTVSFFIEGNADTMDFDFDLSTQEGLLGIEFACPKS